MYHPNSIDGLINWLRTQPPDTAYQYNRGSTCLLARYFRAVGVPCVGVDHVNRYDLMRETPLAAGLDQAAKGPPGGWTYGDALARAEKIKEAENV